MRDDRGVRRGLIAGAAVLVAMLLVACDPPPPDTRVASIRLALGADGTASMVVALQDRVWTPRELEALAAVAAGSLPSAQAQDPRVSTSRNAFAVSFDRAFVPGTATTVDVDLRPLVDAVLGSGARDVEVAVAPPDVPVTADWVPAGTSSTSGGWTWSSVTSGDEAPYGTVELEASPWAAVRGLIAIVVAALLLAVSAVRFAHGSRRTAIVLASVALVLVVVAFALPGQSGVPQLVASGTVSPDTGDHLQAGSAIALLVEALAAGALILVFCFTNRPRPFQPLVAQGGAGTAGSPTSPSSRPADAAPRSDRSRGRRH